jgi:DNA polymerase I
LTVSGWLFDAHPSNGKMVFWIKDENGNTIRLDDSWTPSIYVGSDSRADLDILVKNQAVQHYIKSHDFVSRFERIGDHEQSKVLELTLADSSKVTALANAIEDIDAHDKFRLYNVDVLPQQSYFYEHDLFPLAKCRVDVKDGRVEWQVNDSVRSTSYQPPEFKVAELDVAPRQQGRLPSFDDRIDKITLKLDIEIIEIQKESEADVLSEFMKEIARIDPDFIFISDGKNDALKNCHVTF